MERTTIILGAGASYNSIPIVREIVNHLPSFIHQLNNIGKNDPNISILIEYLQKLNSSLEFTITPDASMHKFFNDPNEDFNTWIKVFWIYFTAVEFMSRNFLGSQKDKIDKRYSEFISDYILTNQSEINFLSWNYDLQLERAYAHMNGLSIVQAAKKLGSISTNKNDNLTPKLLHLNGICGIYKENESTASEYKSFINDPSENMDLPKLIKQISPMIINENRFSFTESIRFNFMNNEEELSKLKSKMSRMVAGNEKLVFIGYSFPKMNESVDRMVFENAHSNVQITLINNESKKDIIANKFNLNRNQITESLDVNSFQFL